MNYIESHHLVLLPHFEYKHFVYRYKKTPTNVKFQHLRVLSFKMNIISNCPLYRWSGSNRHVLNGHGILSPARLPVPPHRLKKFGGGNRIRTGDKGFADLCLTTWLCRHKIKISGRRDSNPRPPPWQGGILPLNYFRIWLGY